MNDYYIYYACVKTSIQNQALDNIIKLYFTVGWRKCQLNTMCSSGCQVNSHMKGNKTRDNLLTNETLLIKNYHRC